MNDSEQGLLIYHIFADRGIESEVLESHGRVVRIGIDPLDGFGEVVKADATSSPLQPGADLALLQPPCTRWSDMTSIDGNPEDHPNLIPEARQLGERLADQYIIENKPQAPLENATVLDGRMFGLPIDYERAFETSFHVPQPRRHERFDGPESSPYLYASHSREWWAATKGYSDVHPKQPIAKNSIPAPYIRHLIRAYFEAEGQGEVRDYSSYETGEQRARKQKEQREQRNAALGDYA